MDLSLSNSDLWTPSMNFENMVSPDSWEEEEESRNLTLIRIGSYIYKRSDKTENKNIYLFEGSQNYIEYTKLFSTVWVCHYDMFWYPFDTQICSA